MAWALERLDEPLDLDALAGARVHERPHVHAPLPEARPGRRPGRWLLEQRVRASLALLEASDASIETVAGTVGFASAATYRHHFARDHADVAERVPARVLRGRRRRSPAARGRGAGGS